MDHENEIAAHIITDEDHQETDEIHEIDASGQLSVIPFQLIKITKTNHNHPPRAPEFATVVKGKYSKYYKQTYRPAWEHMPDFKGWLKGVKGEPTRAYCTYCQKTLHAHRLSLLKHTCTIRHQKAAQLHGNPGPKKVNFNLTMENRNIQSAMVNEESFTEEDDSNELIQPQIVYTTQEEIEDAEQDQDTENDNDNDDDSDEGEESASSVLHENHSLKKQNISSTPPISTHVIDTTRGVPVSGLSVSLYKLVDGRWTYINEGLTDTGGRFSNFIARANFTPGRYKLHYDVDRYFEARKLESLYPFIEVVFDSSTLTRYHFPLLLSPNSYTTYRSTHDD